MKYTVHKNKERGFRSSMMRSRHHYHLRITSLSPTTYHDIAAFSTSYLTHSSHEVTMSLYMPTANAGEDAPTASPPNWMSPVSFGLYLSPRGMRCSSGAWLTIRYADVWCTVSSLQEPGPGSLGNSRNKMSQVRACMLISTTRGKKKAVRMQSMTRLTSDLHRLLLIRNRTPGDDA